ncbi:MAG: hypothetical protein AAF730_13285 [Bacteroidota bacterium]
MRPIRILSISLIALFWALAVAQPAKSDPAWRIVKKYLQADVIILEETAETMTIRHSVRGDTLRIGVRPCADCDIYGRIEARRGSNPYRVWVASARFWDNPQRPRNVWGQYFRSSFLRILRPPQTEG